MHPPEEFAALVEIGIVPDEGVYVESQRCEGRLHLVGHRIEEGPLLAPLTAELSRKYLGGAEVDVEAVTSGYLWLFELVPRS